MRNPYQPVIDVLRTVNVGLQLNGPRSNALDGIHVAMNHAVSYLWVETDLYTIKEMLEEASIPTSEIIGFIADTVRKLRGV